MPTESGKWLWLLVSHNFAGILHVQIVLSHWSMETYKGTPYTDKNTEWYLMQVGKKNTGWYLMQAGWLAGWLAGRQAGRQAGRHSLVGSCLPMRSRKRTLASEQCARLTYLPGRLHLRTTMNVIIHYTLGKLYYWHID